MATVRLFTRWIAALTLGCVFVVLMVLRWAPEKSTTLNLKEDMASFSPGEIFHPKKLLSEDLIKEYHEERNELQQQSDSEKLQTAYKQRCEKVSRPQHTKLHKSVWHTLTNTSHSIYMYRAVYDDRAAGGALPYVRVLAVGSNIRSIFCQLWYQESLVPYVVEASISHNGRGHPIGNKHFDQYYFNCALKMTEPQPTSVSIVFNMCDTPENLLPVYVPPKQMDHEFGICVASLYWNIDPYRLIEWLEVQRALGATEINFYLTNVTNAEALKVLNHYTANGTLVKVFQNPPIKNGNTRDEISLPKALSLDDCFWRNMYRYKLTIICDIDEVILPQKVENYHDLISSVNRRLNISGIARSYSFRQMYFWVSCNMTVPEPDHSFVFRFLKRENKTSDFLYGGKFIIDPRRCLSIFNHYCWIQFPSLRSSPEPWTLDIQPRDAYLAHYRHLHDGKSCREKEPLMIADTRMLTFKDKVHPHVAKQTKTIMSPLQQTIRPTV